MYSVEKAMSDKPPWHIAGYNKNDIASVRRYKRALCLSKMQADLILWEQNGVIDLPHFAARVAYRRFCVEHWQDYLEETVDHRSNHLWRQ